MHAMTASDQNRIFCKKKCANNTEWKWQWRNLKEIP
jgi:hypothetical protein